LLIVAVPSPEQVAAVVLIVGIEGVDNCAATLNDDDAAEVQLLLFVAVMV
jgi:hypothetical protein